MKYEKKKQWSYLNYNTLTLGSVALCLLRTKKTTTKFYVESWCFLINNCFVVFYLFLINASSCFRNKLN